MEKKLKSEIRSSWQPLSVASTSGMCKTRRNSKKKDQTKNKTQDLPNTFDREIKASTSTSFESEPADREMGFKIQDEAAMKKGYQRQVEKGRFDTDNRDLEASTSISSQWRPENSEFGEMSERALEGEYHRQVERGQFNTGETSTSTSSQIGTANRNMIG